MVESETSFAGIYCREDFRIHFNKGLQCVELAENGREKTEEPPRSRRPERESDRDEQHFGPFPYLFLIWIGPQL